MAITPLIFDTECEFEKVEEGNANGAEFYEAWLEDTDFPDFSIKLLVDPGGRIFRRALDGKHIKITIEVIEPGPLKCQHGYPMNEECPECRQISINLSQPPKNNRVA